MDVWTTRPAVLLCLFHLFIPLALAISFIFLPFEVCPVIYGFVTTLGTHLVCEWAGFPMRRTLFPFSYFFGYALCVLDMAGREGGVPYSGYQNTMLGNQGSWMS